MTLKELLEQIYAWALSNRIWILLGAALVPIKLKAKPQA